MPLIDMLTNISSFDYGKVGNQNLESEEGNYTTNRNTKDSTEYEGVSEVTFDGTGINFPNVNYTPLASAREGSEDSSINLSGPIDVKKNLTTKPNVPIQLYDNPYGALPVFTPLEDRLGDIDEEYKKFGGNAGLRASTPGNDGDANLGLPFGFDSPFIVKEVGDRYDTLDFAVDSTITTIPFAVVRTVEDVIRIGKWTLTPKGIIWNAKQFMLQAQNARGANRLFNPLGPLGSLVPYVHLPRHTKGNFTDFKEPPIYPDKFTDDLHSLKHEEGQAASNVASQVQDDLEDAVSKGLNIQISNRMENLRYYRIEKGRDALPNLNPLASLGFGNKSFVDPPHHVKSTKNPSGGDLKDETGQLYKEFESDGGGFFDEEVTSRQGPLINNYSDLTQFRVKTTMASDVPMEHSVDVGNAVQGTGPTDAEEVTSGDSVKYDTLYNSDVSQFNRSKDLEAASKYNLGRGLIKNNNGLYSVGVSNQLQIPYHGKFGDLNTDQLPRDFIKFRIRDAVNGKWLIFPAMIGAISDTVTPEYTKEAYIGRPDDVHIYSKTSRTVGFDFKVAAFSKQEIPIIQEKMNYLMGLGYPTFKPIIAGDVEERPVTPYIYLTIGDLFNNTPGYFDSIAIATEENGNWEIDEGFQIPMSFNVTVNFVYIGKYLPTTLGKHYDVPWLNDNGAGTGTFSSDPRDGTTNKPDRQGDVGWEADMPSYAQ